MGLIESLETAIAASRRNYIELLELTGQLVAERQQQGQRNWLRLNAKPWTAATLKKLLLPLQPLELTLVSATA